MLRDNRRARGAVLIGLALLVAAAIALARHDLRAAGSGQTQYLDQGWSDDLRQAFYYTPQGSRLLPHDWFVALERADGDGLMASNASLTRYGFIPADRPTDLNPDGLPIGFALDPADVPGLGQFTGLTCAACHTTDVTVDGQTVRIDGGAAHLDFDSFFRDLAAALHHTRTDAEAFQRFAGRLLPDADAEALADLQRRFAMFEARFYGDAVIRRPAIESGFGRVDALTQIVNALAVTAQGEPANLRPVIAPTSYPSLWLTPQLEFVQWNPVAASPIGRNVGEVLGVFGNTQLSGPPEGWFRTSALLRELHLLEVWVEDLQPPPWDEALMGPIDDALAAEGEALYDQHCAGCHTRPPYRMTDPADNFFGREFIAITRQDYRAVGTDPHYVESLSERLIVTNEVTATPFDGAPIVPAYAYFLRVVALVVESEMAALGLSPEERAAMDGFRRRPPAGEGQPPLPYTPPSFTDLKAGPLDGIWATGPYLHNGSVPTLYELLSPEAERRPVFWTGGQELDRERLGFVSEDAPGRFRFDTSVPGNRNIGHVYPPDGLSHDERMALIEFLKTL